MKTTGHTRLTPIQSTLYEERVRHFFLNLYRHQLGANHTDDVVAEAVPVPSEVSGIGTTYELRVNREGKWRSRRMALGLIEEGSGSKSICFKVIYDDLLIVKIPHHPLTEFDKYIERIDFERYIAEKLSPDINCVSPSISAVLGRIPQFSNQGDLPAHQLEKRYVKKLKNNSVLQRHLKIGNTFAFFMELSKHSFLNAVVHRLHHLNLEMQNEIMSHFDTLWNLDFFEKRYGTDNASAFFSISQVLASFESEVALLLEAHGTGSSIPTHTRRQWLLNYLANEEIKPESDQISRQTIEDLKTIMTAISKTYRENIEDYKATIKTYVHDKNFKHNKPQLKQIIGNLLELLTTLKGRGVAIRDLKPENIFFASDTGPFALGLIDFETAVELQNPIPSEIPQPMMGGTPYYATPSHFFKNKLLVHMYADLSRLLYFQDWYAVVGLIFHIVTGDYLFTRTGKLVPEIRQVKKQRPTDTPSQLDFFKQSSRVFWYTAGKEFQTKIETQAKAFKSINLDIPKTSAEMFKEAFVQDREVILTAIAKRVEEQKLFKSEESRRKLINAPSKTIHHWRVSWENEQGVPHVEPQVKRSIVHLMRDLERLKYNLARQTRAMRLMENKPAKSTVYQLINAMFSSVYNYMYQKDKIGSAADVLELAYPEMSSEVSTLIETTLEEEEEEL